jgi:hypothetical protein
MVRASTKRGLPQKPAEAIRSRARAKRVHEDEMRQAEELQAKILEGQTNFDRHLQECGEKLALIEQRVAEMSARPALDVTAAELESIRSLVIELQKGWLKDESRLGYRTLRRLVGLE